MSPRNGGSARQGASKTASDFSRRPRYHRPPTPLQVVLAQFGDAFQQGSELLDERDETFVSIATIRVARENAKRMQCERRRAA